MLREREMVCENVDTVLGADDDFLCQPAATNTACTVLIHTCLLFIFYERTLLVFMLFVL